MEELTVANRPLFDKLIVNSENNQELRSQCEEKISQMPNGLQNYHIIYYTSNLEILVDKKPMKLYSALNELMREQPFGVVSRIDYNKWQYMFINSLLKNLKLLKEYKGDLYRGVSHNETYEVGQVLTFRQFTSCSTNINSALNFALTALYILKGCKVGRSIKDHSLF